MERTTMADSRWYSPENVISHFHNDLDFPVKPTKINRKAEELYNASVALVGIQKHEKKQYWIQPVSDSEQSPDVRTIALYDRTDEKAPDGVIQDVEVVSYEFSASETLPDFLLRTKFSDGKAYDEKTTILLHVKEKAHCPAAQVWRDALQGTKSKSPVIILGRNDETEPEYGLIQVFPAYQKIIDFNLVTALKEKTDNVGTMNLGRGSRPKDVHNEETHCPFEKLGIKCRVL